MTAFVKLIHIRQIVIKLIAPFTREWWHDAFEPTADETLVAGKLLSYAYLEVGLIQSVGGYVTTLTELCASTTEISCLLQTSKLFHHILQELILPL